MSLNSLSSLKKLVGCMKNTVSSRAPAKATVRLSMEALEERALMSADWFSTYIQNTAVANLARNDWNNHGVINYNDMLGIYSQVEKDGIVDSSEFASLKFLATYGNLVNTPDSVCYLENQVVGSNAANQTYQGHSLVNLGVNCPGSQLKLLANKWFLGMDHPTDAQGAAYRTVGGNLFGSNGPSYTDVAQGAVGDCSLLSALAETASRDVADIKNMFAYDGNNVWTVRFYQNGARVYVTVDNYLPNGGGYYDHPQNGVLWASLAEKAYAELNAFDNQDGVSTSLQGKNSYNSLNGLDPGKVLNALTNRPSYQTYNATNIAQALSKGDLIVLGSSSTQGSTIVETDHAYAVLGYNSTTKMYTLFNPWGVNGGTDPTTHQFKPGTILANAAYLETYFHDLGGYVKATPEGQTTEVASSQFLATDSGRLGGQTSTLQVATLGALPAFAQSPPQMMSLYPVFADLGALESADLDARAGVMADKPGNDLASDFASLASQIFAELGTNLGSAIFGSAI